MRTLSYVMPETFGERVADALTMLAKGVLMVFLVLSILMVVLMIMERQFASKSESKKEKQEKAARTPVAETPVEAIEDNGALVAAITAAISVVLASEHGGTPEAGGFRVVSFKRVGGKSAWNSK